MTRTSGFTLLELIVALAITGVVALLVYGAARAGYDTAERIATSHRAVQSARAMRTLLADALRGTRSIPRVGDTVFALEPRSGAGGRPADRVTFTTQGGFPPLEPEADWIVTVRSTPEGLSVSARPKALRAPSSVEVFLSGVTGLKVEVRTGAGWTHAWPAFQTVPSAVRVTYWSDSGEVGVPLVVALDVGAER